MVPTHFRRLLALPAEVRARFDLSSLKLISHTGASCPPEVKRAMIEWVGPILLEVYGGTETGPATSITSAEALAHPGSVGRAAPPYEVVVVGEDDQPLPPGEEGRLVGPRHDIVDRDNDRPAVVSDGRGRQGLGHLLRGRERTQREAVHTLRVNRRQVVGHVD